MSEVKVQMDDDEDEELSEEDRQSTLEAQRALHKFLDEHFKEPGRKTKHYQQSMAIALIHEGTHGMAQP